MSKIDLSKDNKKVDYFGDDSIPMMGMAMMGRSLQNHAKPKSRHIILKIVLLIWLIFTIRTVVSVIQEKIEMDNSIEVTAIVTDCIMHETWDENAGTSVYYTTSLRWTLDKTYEGKTTLSKRHEEGDYVTINVSSKDNSKIVSDVDGLASTLFVIILASLSVLVVIITIHEQISE